MTRRAAILAALAAAALLGACAGGDGAGGADGTDAPSEPGGRAALADRPPVIVIVLDALSASHVTHLGYHRDTTPAIDAIAAEGATFTNCIVPAPFTVASVPSLMTGRLPDSHGVISSAFRIRPDEVTLAEYLSGDGYRTVAVCSQPNGGPATGNDDGFDEFLELWVPEEGEEPDYVLERRAIAFMIPSADEVVDEAERYLADAVDDPLFLYVHILEPHTPFMAPPEVEARFVDPAYDGPFRGDDKELLLLETVRGNLEATPQDIAHVTALYDANLAWADQNVGRFVERLKATGVWDEALVILTSDHGEAHWQHGTWGHNWQLYEEFVRVPLIVKLPAGAGPVGARIEPMVSTIDVLPSVCALLGIEPDSPYALDGVSFVPLLEGAAPGSARELLLRSSHQQPFLGLRSDAAKTIVRPNQQPFVEHYDLARDPTESRNLAEAERDGLAPRISLLRSRFEDLSAQPGFSADVLSARDQAMLEALGYVDER